MISSNHSHCHVAEVLPEAHKPQAGRCRVSKVNWKHLFCCSTSRLWRTWARRTKFRVLWLSGHRYFHAVCAPPTQHQYPHHLQASDFTNQDSRLVVYRVDGQQKNAIFKNVFFTLWRLDIVLSSSSSALFCANRLAVSLFGCYFYKLSCQDFLEIRDTLTVIWIYHKNRSKVPW